MLGRDCGDSGWKLSLTYMTTRCHVQTGEPVPQITHLGLTVWGTVMHHVYGLTYTGVGFSCPCYTLINTHARTRGRPGRRSRKASWWMCACSRGCLRCMAADRCWRSLQKTLLTNGVSAIHQADYQPSSSPQPSHVCLPTPKRVRTHNGSWTSVQKTRSFTPVLQNKTLVKFARKVRFAWEVIYTQLNWTETKAN